MLFSQKKQGFTPLEIQQNVFHQKVQRRSRLTAYSVLNTKSNLKFLTGFTILEIILVVSITMIIFVATTANFYSYRQRRELNSISDLLVVYLSLAKQKAVVIEEDVNWGVHLEASSTAGHFYSLFASSTYFAAGEREKMFLPSRVQFSDPAAGQSKDFIFEKNSGKITANSATSAVIYLVAEPARTKTITVNAFGKIEMQ